MQDVIAAPSSDVNVGKSRHVVQLDLIIGPAQLHTEIKVANDVNGGARIVAGCVDDDRVLVFVGRFLMWTLQWYGQ